MTTVSALLRTAAAHAAGGDVAAAIAAYRAVIALTPGLAEAWFNLGALQVRAGASAEALASFAQAATLRADWAAPMEARGRVLFARGDFREAALAFETATRIAPDAVHAYANLGLCRQRLAQWSLAVAPLARARDLAPADEAIWWTLRGTLLALRRDEDALADFLRLDPHAPRSVRVLVAALVSARRMGDAAREERALAAALAHEFVPGDSALVGELLALLQYSDVAPAQLMAMYETCDRLTRAELPAARLAPTAARVLPRGDPRWRIGYLSADFRRHVMGELLAPVFAAHDRTRFAVHFYSLALAGNADDVTDRFRAHGDRFADLAALDDAAAAQAIAADDLDLLVDLMGQSAFARPGILARKPARVVATHLGAHGGLGLRAVDYKITDRVADLPNNARHQLEALLSLDVCVLPLRRYAMPPRRWTRAELNIAGDAIVAATFVGVQKLSPRCLALWRAWLAAVPEGVLLFSPQRDDDRAAIVRRCAGFGVTQARLRFVPYVLNDPDALAARYALADVALDTLPYTGGDTTAASLAAGVPVVTRSGIRHAERMSASILTHAGLADLIVADDDAYVKLAVGLAHDAAFRDAQRARVRAALARPGLSDPASYALALEAAYTRALAQRNLTPL